MKPGWEQYIRPDGRKDVRPIGSASSFGTIPREHRAAKRAAVQAEIRARDLAAAERQAVQIARELARKAQAGGPSSSVSIGAKPRVIPPKNLGVKRKP